MRKIKSVLLICFTVVFLCSCVNRYGAINKHDLSGELNRIVQTGELVVGTVGNMPPMNMTTKEGEVIGFEMDMARMMAKELGVNLKIKVMDFHELLPALEMKSVDIIMSGMTITPVRNLRFAFVGPYFTSGKAFLAKSITLANITDATEVNSPGTKVTALKGSTSQQFVESVMPRAELIATDDYDEAIRLVLEDRVHALVADYPICVVALFRYPDAGFVSIETTLTYEPYGIAMNPNDPHLINWMENFLGVLEGSGNLQYLEDKWFSSADWVERIW